MKPSEAAEILKGIEEFEGNLPEDGLLVEEAWGMAIAALEKQEKDRWIPVTERLPEEYGEYRITWKTSSDPGKRFIGNAEYEPGFEWDDAHDRFFGEWLLEDYVKAYPDVEVTAWKPIGEPYTEEEDDKS